MPDEPEEGFTVRDRRRFMTETSDAAPVTADKEAPRETPSPVEPPAETKKTRSAPPLGESGPVSAFAPPPATPTTSVDDVEEGFDEGAYFADEQLQEGMGMPEEFTLPDIYSVLLEFLGVTRSHALLRMGLFANPSTGKTERDMDQAKVAIDTAAFLVSQLERVVAPEERLPLRALLSDLQMNYVEQSKRGG